MRGTQTRRPFRSGALALTALLTALASSGVAEGAGPEVRASSEVGAYRDSFATQVITPTIAGSVADPVAGWSGQGRYLVDVVSAASPDVVSTASPHWNEVRHAGNVDARYKPGAIGGGIAASVSSTPDYLSRGIQGSGSIDLGRDKAWTLSGALGFARDTIGRTGTAFSTFSHDLDIVSGSVGLTRVVDQRTLAVLVADAYLESGDQSKPYRYVPLFRPGDEDRVPRGASVDQVARLRIQPRPLEQLPLTRNRVALTARLAHRFEGVTVRAEERVYADSWGMPASTTEVRVYFDLGRRWIVGPSIRAHAQGRTAFYRRVYTSTGPGDLPAIRTGDRELGGIFSLSTGGLARLGIGPSYDPMKLVVGLSIDTTFTHFADALYTTSRIAGLAAGSFEVRF